MFKVEYIEYLIGLFIIPIVGILMYFAWASRKRIISKLGDFNLIKSLIPGYSDRLFWRNNALILGGLLFLIIAGTNPQWGTKRENVKTQSSDIFIALDISNSMMAEDIAPSRIERAKRFTQELVKELRGNRIGLILFAGGAFIQMPLTNDYAAAELMVKSASPLQAGTQGTAISEAITIAEEGFMQDKANQRALIIITDGEDHEAEAISLASKAKDDGCFIYTIGVGTETGAQIPIVVNGRRGYKTDSEGNTIITKLNVSLINELASAGGGKPFLVNQGKEAITRIVEDIDKLEKREVQQQSFSEYNSYFQYFLGIGLCLILLGLFLPSKTKSN